MKTASKMINRGKCQFSVTLLAYESDTEKLLGWHKLKDSTGESYFNARKWLTYKGNL